MLLRELFEDADSSLVGDMRQQVMDYLTPLAARNVKEISMDDIVEALKSYRNGLAIDRDLLMTILDPDQMKLVKKIDGDTVYLTMPVNDMADSSQSDQEKNIKHIRNKAQKAAQKAIKK